MWKGLLVAVRPSKAQGTLRYESRLDHLEHTDDAVRVVQFVDRLPAMDHCDMDMMFFVYFKKGYLS